MSYGEKIAKLRRQKGLTQAALGAELNVTYQAVSKWERNESVPDFPTMTKLARLFDVPLTYFAEDDPAESQESDASSEEQLEPIEELIQTQEEIVSIEASDEVVEEIVELQEDARQPEDSPEELAEEPASAVNTQPEQEAAPIAAAVPVAAPSERQPARMLGVCSVCGKTVYEGNVGATSPALLCKACVTKQAEKKAAPKTETRREKIRYRDYETDRLVRRRNVGLIVSACITLAIVIIGIISLVSAGEDAGVIALGVAGTVVFLFPFIAQLFWDGFIVGVVLAGVKVIGTPGIIFTLDLNGIFFLIAMKILFAVLRFLIMALIFLFMCFVAILLSPFAIVPQAIKLSRGEEL